MNHDLLTSMQAFVSVVDSGSFSESARRLGLSQPSVSRQINALEEHLGVRLLQRSTRRLSLTEAGRIYYDKARKIQLDVFEAKQSISSFSETPSGKLKISTPYVWVETKITPWLDEFLRTYPEISIDIECNDQIQDLIEDQLDLVIRVGDLQDSSLIAVPFGKIRLVLCATKTYLERNGRPRTPDDLRNHPFILFKDFNQILITPEDGSPQQIEISGPVSSNNVSVMLAALNQHLGLAVLPDLLIDHFLERGTLVDVMPQAEFLIKHLPVSQVYALYSNRRHLPAKVRAFLDFFRPRFR